MRQIPLTLLTMLFALVLLGGCARDRATVQSLYTASPEGKRVLATAPRIAILDFRGTAGPAFSDVLAIEFLKKGYDVVDRTNLSDVLLEQSLSIDGYKELSDQEKAVRLGQILNADIILTGNLLNNMFNYSFVYDTNVSDNIRTTGASETFVTCRAFDTKSGEIIWVGTVKCNTYLANGEDAKLLSAWRGGAKDIVDSFTRPDYTGTNSAYKGSRIYF